MEMLWHRVSLPCPDCSREITILAFLIKGNGEIRCDCCCASCGIKLQWETTLMCLISFALQSDYMKPYEQQLKGDEN